MKIVFFSVGKKHDPALAESINDFTARIGHYSSVEWRFVAPSQTVESEGKSILAALEDKDIIVLLDEKGKEVTSQNTADFIQECLNRSAQRIVFIIGGAYGASAEVAKRANTTIALSRLTFPHQLVRLILAEQIYRAFTILRGEKYHHS